MIEFKVVDTYDIGKRRTTELEAILNQFGADGWDLVSVLPVPASRAFTLVFKRLSHRRRTPEENRSDE